MTKSKAEIAEVYDVKGRKLHQYIAAVAVCIGALAAGGVVGWTATITQNLKDGEFNGLQINDSQLSWIGALVPLGATLMCLPIALMVDKLGRKLALMIFTIPFLGGWLLIIFSNNLAMLFVGRFITGMAGGAFCVAAPLYTTEIAEKEVRGVLGTYYQLFLVAGTLVANSVSYFLPLQYYTIVIASLPLVFAIVFIFQPETPIFRLKQGREDDARVALVRLRGKKYDVDQQLQSMKILLEQKRTNKVTFGESIKKKGTKKAALICFTLMFFQQMSGIKATIFYTAAIFAASGAKIDEKVSSIIYAAISTTATVAASFVVDRLGRKILLITSGIFMAVGLTAIGVFFSMKERKLVSEEVLETYGFIPIVGLSTYSVFYSLGFAPVPWVMSAELFPPEIKSMATASAGTFNWFMGFLLTKFFLDLNKVIGGDGTFYMFAGFSVLGAVFAFFMVPETKGKSLEQIQQELNR